MNKLEKLIKLDLDKEEALLIGVALASLADKPDVMLNEKMTRDICDLLDKLDHYSASNNIWAKFLASLCDRMDGENNASD
jgi:hypothetical protein